MGITGAERVVAGRGVESHDGHDAARAVRVTVDQAGLVVDLAVDAGWRDRLGQVGLEHAVLAAVADARERWASGVLARAEHESIPEPADAGAAADRTRLAELDALLGSDGGGLDARLLDDLGAFERRAEKLLSRPVVAGSASRRAQVTMRPFGDVVGVTLDLRWLTYARSDRIAAELREAFRAGHLLAARTAREALTAGGVLGRVQDLMGGPDAALSVLSLAGGSR